MRKRQWVPIHKHTNPLTGGALPRRSIPIPDSPGCSACPADFPYVPPGPLEIIQQSAGQSTRTMSSPISSGDGLVLLGSKRSSAPDWSIYGYSDAGDGNVSNGAADYVKAAYKVAGSDSSTMSATSLNEIDAWYEISPGGVVVDHNSNTGTSGTASTPSVTIPAGGIAFMVVGTGSGGGFDADAGFSGCWTPGAGWTEDVDMRVQDGHPSSMAAHRINATSSAQVITPTADFDPPGGRSDVWPWQMIAVVIGSLAVDNPPLPTQWVYGEVVTMTGTDGTSHFRFIDASIRVYQDGINQTRNLAARDGAAQTWSLDYEPHVGSVITIDYQGAP